ncbi:hypothetical protein HPB50_018093 [Hyalomma asiaticum]|uniref:Uncharacterized protein n=1 Tax=Hyalomma asiaticum TaxID=266040 RepID=A0ACB7TB80_HYAAI|nr:hypothetical protein HPB50_018093 [Hyalomma asiaticum]
MQHKSKRIGHTQKSPSVAFSSVLAMPATLTQALLLGCFWGSTTAVVLPWEKTQRDSRPRYLDLIRISSRRF